MAFTPPSASRLRSYAVASTELPMLLSSLYQSIRTAPSSPQPQQAIDDTNMIAGPPLQLDNLPHPLSPDHNLTSRRPGAPHTHSRQGSMRTQVVQAQRVSMVSCPSCELHFPVNDNIVGVATTAKQHPTHDGIFCNDPGHQANGNTRSKVVDASVKFAKTIKDSGLIEFIMSIIQYFFHVYVYLNHRYGLNQLIVNAIIKFFEALMQFEKEAGVFRSIGEAISVMWEAAVKSSIALAKPDQPGHTHAHAHHSHAHAMSSMEQQHLHSFPTSPAVSANVGPSGYISPPIFAATYDTIGDSYSDEETQDNHYIPVSGSSSSLAPPGADGLRPRTLRRTSWSSPALPMMVSRSSSSSNLLPPASISSSSRSSSESSNPPDYASIERASAPRLSRQRSRSAHAEDRVRRRQSEAEVKAQINLAPQGSGIINRVLFGAAGRINRAVVGGSE